MLKVFLSYTKADHEKVEPFFHRLTQDGFDPWLDSEKLLPGHNWSREIDQALAEANVVMLFLSTSSVSKRGFVQREANQAIENLKSKLPSDIYIIPVLLEDCEVPPHISDRLQFVNVGAPNFWTKILRSLEQAAVEQEIIREQGASHGPFRVFEESISEDWVGTPGHNIQLSFPRFTSDITPDAARTLSAIFSGRAHMALVTNRTKPWHQDPVDQYFGSDNGRWDSYSVVFASERFLSVSYTVGWYGAGAAHPNSHFECHNFAIIESKIYPIELHELFTDWETGRQIIVSGCIHDIQREYWERTGEFPDASSMEWITTGVGDGTLDNFLLTQTGLTFLFSPYEVGPYAFGSFSAHVPFDRFSGGALRNDFIPALPHDPES